MLDITPIPAFDDNYIWLLRAGESKSVAVVDPGEAFPVLEVLRADNLQLEAILLTHKHGDHVGGVSALLQVFPDATVYGPAHEPIALDRVQLTEGDRLNLPFLDVEFEVMEVPGHTEGHIAYYTDGVLFCGDTLFSAGCGRVFSGTHEQLHEALMRFAQLPGETKVYCAHEYTQANIGFALWVEPDNADVQQRADVVEKLRSKGLSTVPSTMAVEMKTNPFLRTDVESVIRAAEGYAGKKLTTGAEVFTAVRTWKDREYD
ncbi:MAG: hydroxyacylglutathione hydrolase [Chromatiales bacterium]|nr:hydroxyacylglutathione hydrolase [Chromatiales bacterium]